MQGIESMMKQMQTRGMLTSCMSMLGKTWSIKGMVKQTQVGGKLTSGIDVQGEVK
jgi:hypothetical protein